MTAARAVGELLEEVGLVRHRRGKPKLRQLYELLQVGLRWRMRPREYYLYRFHGRDRDYHDIVRYLPTRVLFHEVLPALNDARWVPVHDHKWLFHAHYTALGLPLPAVYGLYDPGGGFDLDGEPLRTPEDLERLLRRRQPPSVVIKPVGGTMGQGVLVVDRIEYRRDGLHLVGADGRELASSDLRAWLSADRHRTYRSDLRAWRAAGGRGGYPGFLVQEKVTQHPFLDELCPHTLNTLRVVTFVPAAGDVEIHFAVIRLGRAGNMVDGWLRGGVSVPIDAASGTLGVGRLAPRHGDRDVETHPDTGARFTGAALPHWSDVVELCRRAARATPGIRSAGWDVALTPSGPLLMEGNPVWNLEMVQVHTSGYLQPALREKLRPFGLSFPDRLPRVNRRLWSDDVRRAVLLARSRVARD